MLFCWLIDLDRSHLTSFQNIVYLRRFCVFEIKMLSSTSHMASHICWFPYAHRQGRAIDRETVQSSETIGFRQLSTRRLALDCASPYRFSPNYKHLICRNYIFQHSPITYTTVKQCPLAFILFDFQDWDSPASFPSALFWCGKPLHHTHGITSLYHILTSFVDICSPTGRVMGREVVE